MNTPNHPAPDYIRTGIALSHDMPQARTFSTKINGQTIWFKRTVPAKATIWHRIQHGFAMVLRRPILRSTASRGGDVSLRAEAARLILFKQYGFRTPDVLALGDDIMALSDAGAPLSSILESADTHERYAMLRNAVQALSKLHNAGLVHGRPYLRDMTWDGHTVGFLDLEENPVTVMPLPAAQARDIWIFLLFASRYARSPRDKKILEGDLVTLLYREYRVNAQNDVIKALRDFVFLLSPFRKCLDHQWLRNRIGNDARQAVFTNKCLELALK